MHPKFGSRLGCIAIDRLIVLAFMHPKFGSRLGCIAIDRLVDLAFMHPKLSVFRVHRH